MFHRKLLFFFFGILATLSSADTADNKARDDMLKVIEPSIVKIHQIGRRFELTRNGKPYFINGAGGSNHLDMLVKAGGNSIRTWSSSREALDEAQEKGLTVCMGLRMRKPRRGADYTDTKMLKEQETAFMIKS